MFLIRNKSFFIDFYTFNFNYNNIISHNMLKKFTKDILSKNINNKYTASNYFKFTSTKPKINAKYNYYATLNISRSATLP
jgi:hypothetical protein